MTDTYLTTLSRDVAIIGAVPRDRLGAEVPSCPGWSMTDLLEHLGRVHRWVLAALASGPDDPMPSFPPRLDSSIDVADWFAEGAAELVGALSSVDLESVRPTFVGPRPAQWWLRRQVFENAVHRWDAQTALGPAPDPIELAADGIDEWVMLRTSRSWSPGAGIAGSIHLHGTDGEGEWLFEFADESFAVSHGHHKGDAAVRGSLSDLCLLVWGRVSPDQLEVLGDGELVARFLAAT